MTKKAIVVASFGTSKPDTLQKTILAVEQEVQNAYPHWQVVRAFTSSTIRKIWQQRGLNIEDLPGALQKLQQAHAQEVVILPTHLLAGEEYQKLCGQAGQYQGVFQSLKIAKPLLYHEDDWQAFCRHAMQLYPSVPNQALVWMGHGSLTQANHLYEKLNEIFKAHGRSDIFVGTVEAQPGVEEILQRVQKAGFQTALLAPLMLVAGDHAQNDMAGDAPDSWKNLFLQAGIAPICDLRGLGEHEVVRKMYTARLAALAEE